MQQRVNALFSALNFCANKLKHKTPILSNVEVAKLVLKILIHNHIAKLHQVSQQFQIELKLNYIKSTLVR